MEDGKQEYWNGAKYILQIKFAFSKKVLKEKIGFKLLAEIVCSFYKTPFRNLFNAKKSG